MALVMALVVAGGVVVVLKRVYNVERPVFVAGISIHYRGVQSWYDGVTPVPDALIAPEHHDRSFPSGHALAAFALAGVLWHDRRARWWGIVVASLIGVSRILIGVHFPADVLAGACLGFLIGFLVMHWLLGRESFT